MGHKTSKPQKPQHLCDTEFIEVSISKTGQKITSVLDFLIHQLQNVLEGSWHHMNQQFCALRKDGSYFVQSIWSPHHVAASGERISLLGV